MKFEYGTIYWNRLRNSVDELVHEKSMNLALESGSSLQDLLEAAGTHGWELCAALPDSSPGVYTADAYASGGKREMRHENETFRLIFKRGMEVS